MIYFLIFLLLSQSGCTAVGHISGKDIDVKKPKKTSIKNYEDLRVGDLVELSLRDDSVLLGKISKVDVQKFVGITRLDTNPSQDGYWEVEVYEWNEVKNIRKIEERETFQIVLTLLGLGIDLAIVLYFVTMWMTGAAVSGLS